MKLPFKVPIILGLLVGGGVFALFLSRDSVGVLLSEETAAARGEAVAVASAPSGTKITSAAIAGDAQIPEGYIEYRNTSYGFSFYHSPEGIVREYDEGGGAMTVTLENLERIRGLQVFIVPYQESTISEERFQRDVPSGIRTEVANTSVDGVRAVTFKSKDALLGDTREIWFIRDGYLYEVTTFSGTANWFIPIINSWRFL